MSSEPPARAAGTAAPAQVRQPLCRHDGDRDEAVRSWEAATGMVHPPLQYGKISPSDMRNHSRATIKIKIGDPILVSR